MAQRHLILIFNAIFTKYYQCFRLIFLAFYTILHGHIRASQFVISMSVFVSVFSNEASNSKRVSMNSCLVNVQVS